MLDKLLDDLEAEQAALDAVVNRLAEADLERPTPAEGWSVRDQLSHLAFSEELAGLAVNDAERFGTRLGDLLGDLQRAESEPRDRAGAMMAAALLQWWQEA